MPFSPGSKIQTAFGEATVLRPQNLLMIVPVGTRITKIHVDSLLYPNIPRSLRSTPFIHQHSVSKNICLEMGRPKLLKSNSKNNNSVKIFWGEAMIIKRGPKKGTCPAVSSCSNRFCSPKMINFCHVAGLA